MTTGKPDAPPDLAGRLAEQAGAPMCCATPAGRIVYLNPALRQLLGLASTAGAPELADCCAPREQPRLARDILPAALTRGAWSGELSLLTGTGRALPAWLDMRIMPDDTTGMPALACTFTDLSRWKQLEQDLRASAVHQRTLADHIPQRVFFKDRHSRYLAANRPYAADLGIAPDEIIGLDDYAFHPCELAEHYRRIDQRVMNSGTMEEMDESYVRDGREYTIHTIKTPVRDGDGRTVGLCGIFWDVSEQRRLEARLTESEATLRAIYENAQEGIQVVAAATGRLTMVNPAICRILGYSAEEMLGRPPEDFHPPELHPYLREIFADMAQGDFHPVEEVPFLRKDGSQVYLDVSAGRVLIAGTPCYLGVFRDVTERRQDRKRLARSEALLAEAQSLVHLGNWNQDLTTGQTYWSDEMYRLFGHAPGAVAPGRETFLAALPPEERETVLAKMNKPLAPGENGPFRVEHRVRRPDGERIVEQQWRLVCAADGKPLRVYGTALDITERRSAQARAEMLQRVADNSSQGIGWTDLDGRVRYLNRALRDLLGLGAHEDVGAYRLVDFCPAARNWELRERILPTVRSEGSWTGEFAVRARDGNVTPALYDVFALRDGMNHMIALAVMITDLSAHKRTEAELAGYRDQLEELVRQRTAELARQSLRNTTILDTALDGFFAIDTRGRITDANPAYGAMLGFSREELLARGIGDIESNESPAAIAARIARVQAAGHDRFESRHRRSDGVLVDVEISVRHVEIAGQEELLCFVRDISGRKRHEAALLASRQEAERANAAKSEFLSRMSHELRTPLNAIIGFAQLLEIPDQQPLSAQQAENVHEILVAGRHLLGQVNEILDLARIESGRLHLDIGSVRLAPLVDDCLRQLRPLAAQREIAVGVDLAAAPAVLADGGQLKLVLLNLLGNAIKYNRRGGSVAVRAAAAAAGLRVTVSDSGRGIAPDHLHRLFRPFERLESSYDAIEGTGIGLALVKKLVEAMDGRVGVDSTPGVGSTFWFELPTARPEAADASVAPAGATAAPPAAKVGAGDTAAPPPATARRRVLYVEDNPSNLKLVRKLLELRPQLELHEAGNAERGIELAGRLLPDLILLDINLPGMDGFAAIAALRAAAATREIPVVAVTANAMKRDLARGKAAGFTDYLAKPFDVATFLKTIDRHLSIS